MKIERVLIATGILLLLVGAVTGALGYAAYDARRDARIEAEADRRVREAEAARQAAEAASRLAMAQREVAETLLGQEQEERAAERRRLRNVADRAQQQADSIVAGIIAEFPSAEQMVRDLEARYQEQVAAADARAESALAEVAAVERAREADGAVIRALLAEVDAANLRTQRADEARVAAQRAAASRESWMKWGGGTLTVLLVALAVAAR